MYILTYYRFVVTASQDICFKMVFGLDQGHMEQSDGIFVLGGMVALSSPGSEWGEGRKSCSAVINLCSQKHSNALNPISSGSESHMLILHCEKKYFCGSLWNLWIFI